LDVAVEVTAVPVAAPVSVVELAGSAPVEMVVVVWVRGCFSLQAVRELSTAAATSE